MRLNVLLALLPVVLGAPAKRSEPAPLLTPRGDADSLIAGKYIVKFRDVSALSVVDDALSVLDEAPEHVFKSLFRGFAATLDDATLQALRDHPDVSSVPLCSYQDGEVLTVSQVEYIEQDAIATISTYVTQPSAPSWGLGRLSDRDGSTTYTYDDSAGSGTCSYVLDTGIDTTHSVCD